MTLDISEIRHDDRQKPNDVSQLMMASLILDFQHEMKETPKEDLNKKRNFKEWL